MPPRRSTREKKPVADDAADDAPASPPVSKAKAKAAANKAKKEEKEKEDKPVKKAPAKRGKKAAAAADDDDDAAAAADSAPAAPEPAKKGKGKAAKRKADDDDDGDDAGANQAAPADDSKTTSVVVKGVAAVDSHFPNHANYHVYTDASGPWDFTGNQTNIGNNNNKYYILQLLESDKGKEYVTWTRWGRVGVAGQNQIIAQGSDLNNCKRQFEKKFTDKTRNHWANKNSFKASPGKYDLVRIDYSGGDDKPKADAAPKKKTPKDNSKLDPAVRKFTELIFDVKKMTDAVVEMKYDVNKLPLGKLTSEQIKAGYQALQDLEDLITKKASRAKLEEASSTFYTRIPHTFGMKRPPIIDDMDVVKEKLQLLEALGDIKVALKLIGQGQDDADAEAEVDKHYKSLGIDLDPIDPSDEEYKIVSQYMQNTHGKTHASYSLEIQSLFRLNKKLPYRDDIDNKMLLWHGSRLTNWAGILSQGLRIAPPEAPCTGYMFGKGVYFADAVSKSANYCFTSRANNTGVLLLCEVALGTQNKVLASNSMLHLQQPKGTHSTFGMGQTAPDDSQSVFIDKGKVKVPAGPLAPTGVTNPSGFTLAYNEFIVYDTAQVKPRYLIQTKFNYK